MKPPESPLKARECPYSTHNTLTMPSEMKDIISMLSTLLERTMPP